MTPEEKRARAARKHVRRAVAKILGKWDIVTALPLGALGHSTKDFTAANKAFKELVAELRKG